MVRALRRRPIDNRSIARQSAVDGRRKAWQDHHEARKEI